MRVLVLLARTAAQDRHTPVMQNYRQQEGLLLALVGVEIAAALKQQTRVIPHCQL